MFTLESFYKSREWRKLLQVVRAERIGDEGVNVCEYCGKPIVKQYDCIGHHKEPLTEENVNDYNVSLNPDNIELVHHACHNAIHNKLGYQKREVYLVYGSPLAGKTTYVETVRTPGDLIVDIDSIWECVSGCERFTKPARLNAVVFKIRDELLQAVKYRLGKWNNAYIIGGYPLKSERERLLDEMGAREVYVETSRDVAMQRLDADSQRDKNEWKKYIDEWWRLFSIDQPETV